MSIDWANWVWENGPENVQDNLVLLRLAYRADQDGFCFPSIADVVKGTRLSERAVCRSISSLHKEGWMEILKGGGRGKTSQYHLIKRVPAGQSLETPERVPVGQSLNRETLPAGQSNGTMETLTNSPETLTNSPETLTNRQNPLHPLNGRKVIKGQEPYARARVSPAVSSPSPNGKTDEAHMVAAEVTRAICVTSWKVRDEIIRQAEIELENGTPMDMLAEGMVTQYKKFRECVKLGRLKFDWGAEKFFGNGLWRNSKEWGLKKGMTLDGIKL